MDGVLTDSEPLINAAAIAMFAEKGLAVHPNDFLPFVGTGEDRYIGGVAEKYQIRVGPTGRQAADIRNLLVARAEAAKAFPGAVELVGMPRRGL